MDHTWEQLNALATAHRKRQAVNIIQLMVAAQGDGKSFVAQHKALVAVLKDK